jgi:hypothetical protein
MPDEFILTTSGNYSTTYYLHHSTGIPRWLLMLTPIALATAALTASRSLRQSAVQASRITASSRTTADMRGVHPESAVDEDIRLIAIGCQIALLTSHLVWFHYLVLSLPAFLVLLPQVTHRDFPAGHRILVGLALLVCLAFLGFKPFDSFMQSSTVQRLVQAGFANAVLFTMLAWDNPKNEVEWRATRTAARQANL